MVTLVKFKVANVKYNNGNGALLCSQCRVIIAYGFDHTDEEHYCPKCIEKRIQDERDNG